MSASTVLTQNNMVEPGSILELQTDGQAQERVTVLTEGKVMYTLLNGKPHREMMLLKDWLILVAGSQIMVTTPDGKPPQARSAMIELVAPYPPYIPTAADLPEPEVPTPPTPSYGLRTKLSWKIDDANKITAIVIDKGILQVREIRGGEVVYQPDTFYRLSRKLFPDYAAWVASLPPGGTISAYENDEPPPTYKLLQAKPFPVGDDYTIVAELCMRWHVNSYVLEKPSLLEMLETYVDRRNTLLTRRNSLANLPENRGVRQSLNNQIYYNNTKIRHHESFCAVNNSQQRCRRGLDVVIRQGPKVQVAIAGRYHMVLPIVNTTQFYCDNKRATSFEELGVEMENGRPKMNVIWQGRAVNLNV